MSESAGGVRVKNQIKSVYVRCKDSHTVSIKDDLESTLPLIESWNGRWRTFSQNGESHHFQTDNILMVVVTLYD